MLRAPGAMSVGPMLLQWFLLNLVVAFVAACMAVGSMDGHHAAHRRTGGPARLRRGRGERGDLDGQALGGHAQDLLDALIYAVVTAAVFMWLWP